MSETRERRGRGLAGWPLYLIAAIAAAWSILGLAIALAVAVAGAAHAQLSDPVQGYPDYEPGDWQGRTVILQGSQVLAATFGGAALPNQVATGTTAADAFDTTGWQVVVFATVAPNTGADLSGTARPGVWQTIANDGANALLVYPPRGSGAAIGGLPAGDPLSVAPGVVVTLQEFSPSAWRVINAASGGGTPVAVPGAGVVCSNSAALLDCTIGGGLQLVGSTLSVVFGTSTGQALQGSLRGAANGVASLDSGGKVPVAQLPAGTANGVASLDSGGKVPTSQLPTFPAVPAAGVVCSNGSVFSDCASGAGISFAGNTISVLFGDSTGLALQGSEKGAASGVAALDGNALVSFGELPSSLQVVGLSFGWSGVPGASVMRQVVLPFACDVLASYGGGSGGYSGTAPSANAFFAVSYVHSGSTTAAGSFEALAGSHAWALPAVAGYSLARGDVLQVTSPGTPDATLADAAITVACFRQTP